MRQFRREVQFFTPEGEPLFGGELVRADGRELVVWLDELPHPFDGCELTARLLSDSDGVFYYRVRGRTWVSSPEQPLHARAYFTMGELEKHVQRRGDLKVPVDAVPGLLLGLPGDEELPCTLADLSAGGVQFVTPHPLPVPMGAALGLSFELAGRRFELHVELVRSQAQREGRCAYGCRFFGLSAGDEAALRQYVYNRQMEQAGLAAKHAPAAPRGPAFRPRRERRRELRMRDPWRDRRTTRD